MLKLTGVLILVVGIMGAVNSWNENYKRRIANINAMIELLNKAGYVLIREKRKTTYFFEIMSCGKTDISKICEEIAKSLKSHQYATGVEAWRASVAKYENELSMDKTTLEIIYKAGEVFFAKTQSLMSQQLKIVLEQLEENNMRERKKLEEQKKIVMPLSAFGGVLLIIILV